MEGRKVWQELLILAIILIIFVYAFINVSKLQNKFAASPSLTSNLSELSTVSSEIITISGKTDKGVVLTLNDKEIEEDDNGNFSTTINLNNGENKIVLSAKNKNGKTSTIEKTITKLVVQSPTTTTVPSKSVLSSQAGADLAASGPAENMGILGLVLIILSVYIYSKSISKQII